MDEKNLYVMKDLKAFINKDVLKRMRHNSEANKVCMIWYGTRRYHELLYDLNGSNLMLECSLLDGTKCVLIYEDDLKKMDIPERFREHMIVLKTPFDDLSKAFKNINVRYTRIDDFITSKDYELIDD